MIQLCATYIIYIHQSFIYSLCKGFYDFLNSETLIEFFFKTIIIYYFTSQNAF